ncbi:MAG: NAD(P)-dependent oxidoreductase [Nitrospina sp.]|nr:NAD(P)-dependent oxidoreductase [Nitrospina sp.]MBT5764724.1 NAD(P)-dependent oxidoreductase [Nitrospina sp.]
MILGHTGFLGGSLFRHFKKTGVAVEGFNSATLDLTLPASVAKLSEKLDEETILIVAARNRVEEQHGLKGFNRNILMNQHIAACLEKKRIKKCLYFSSDGVYGEPATNLNRTETDLIQPTTLYGMSSFVGENLLKIMAEKLGTPVLVFRLCRVYGPGDLEISSYGPSKFITTLLKENKISLFGAGEERRAYLLILDLVKIVQQLILSDVEGAFNVGMGASFSFKEIIDVLQKISNKKPDIIALKRTRNNIDLGFNIEKLMGVLPGFKFTSLEQGLGETYESISKNLSILKA